MSLEELNNKSSKLNYKVLRKTNPYYISNIYGFQKISKIYLWYAAMKDKSNIYRQLVWWEMCRIYNVILLKYHINKNNI